MGEGGGERGALAPPQRAEVWSAVGGLGGESLSFLHGPGSVIESNGGGCGGGGESHLKTISMHH